MPSFGGYSADGFVHRRRNRPDFPDLCCLGPDREHVVCQGHPQEDHDYSVIVVIVIIIIIIEILKELKIIEIIKVLEII